MAMSASQSDPALAHRWTVFKALIEHATGLPVKVYQSSDYNGTIQAVASNQVDVVVGLAGCLIELRAFAIAVPTTVTTGGVGTAIGEDSTTTAEANVIGMRNYIYGLNLESNVTAFLTKAVPLGRHFYAWLERGPGAGTITWYGDGGGPAYLIAWNRESLLDSDPGIRALVDLWFKEEVEHSRLLGVMLARLGGNPIESHWSFGLFCGLRRWLGVSFELYALLLTEIVSHVYYKMLHRHGGDDALRGMCRLIIRDEAGHIAFHRARLTSEAQQQGRRYGRLWEGLFRLRGLAAGTVLWMNHRGALRALGGTDREFYETIWSDMGKFITGLRGDLEKTRSGERPDARGLAHEWS